MELSVRFYMDIKDEPKHSSREKLFLTNGYESVEELQNLLKEQAERGKWLSFIAREAGNTDSLQDTVVALNPNKVERFTIREKDIKDVVKGKVDKIFGLVFICGTVVIALYAICVFIVWLVQNINNI